MESLIIFIAIAIISSLFGKKKKTEQKPEKQDQQVKPLKENPFKNLGDFAKDFMEEQKQQLERKPPVVKQVPVPPVEKVAREASRDQGVPRSLGRLSVHQSNKQENIVAEPSVNNFLFSSKDELVKAIVLSEILGPPKSRR